MLVVESFKQGDVTGMVRRIRAQKRPLNLAAMGVLEPAEGAAPESKHMKYRKDTGLGLGVANTLGKPRDGPGEVEPSALPDSMMAPGRGESEWREKGSHGPVHIDRGGSHQRWENQGEGHK